MKNTEFNLKHICKHAESGIGHTFAFCTSTCSFRLLHTARKKISTTFRIGFFTDKASFKTGGVTNL